MNAKILLAGLVALLSLSCSAAKTQRYKEWRAARLADPNYRRAVGMAAAGTIQRNADMAAEANRKAAVPVDYSPTIVNYGGGRRAGYEGPRFINSDSGMHHRIGNTWYHPDGSSTNRIGNTFYNSNGWSGTQIGNTLYGSDGESVNKIGNTYYHSDGRTTRKIGNTYYTD